MSQFSNEVQVQGSVDVNNFPAVQPVSGPLTDTQLRATPVPVTIPTPVPVTTGGTGLSTVTLVSVSPVISILSASNAAKTRVIIYNETGTLFVKYGTGASATSYTTRLTANTVHEVEGYTGIITGVKVSGTTNALVTELGI